MYFRDKINKGNKEVKTLFYIFRISCFLFSPASLVTADPRNYFLPPPPPPPIGKLNDFVIVLSRRIIWKGLYS
jgi:hypothetical protein